MKREPTKKENQEDANSDEKASVTLTGTVDKIIPAIDPRDSEKAQITVEGADHLYRELRVENSLTNATGEEVSLKQGSDVDVTIKADKEAIEKKQKGATS